MDLQGVKTGGVGAQFDAHQGTPKKGRPARGGMKVEDKIGHYQRSGGNVEENIFPDFGHPIDQEDLDFR